MRSRHHVVWTASIAVSLVLAGCAGAPDSGGSSPSAASSSFTPVSVKNCNVDVSIHTPPKAAVTLNQGATEVMLALGLEDRMAGTAYLDDEIADRWKTAYSKVKVLAPKYPSKEAFLAVKPDFAYASYTSAFTEKNLGVRDELKKEKIDTYLSPFYCPNEADRAPGTMEGIWSEVRDIAKIFGVTPRAEKLIVDQKTTLEKIKEQAAGKGKKILWYDSGEKELYAGAGGGGPQIIMDAVGATNIFKDEKGSWKTVSWEKAIAADPDVIVIADASWSKASTKIAYLENDPVISQMKAVKAKAYVTVPFSDSTPGVRIVDGAQKVSEQIAKLK